MPRDNSIQKVLVIGSGPIVIGQAAEFDYAGTQACQALRSEGIEVVLVNSNPATIMTDTDIADIVYIEPLVADVLENIIKKERPDSLLPTLGGQTGLNLAMELYETGVLDKYNVRLLGTNTDAIKKAEDRQAFKDTMLSIGEPCIASRVVNTLEDALDFAQEVGYPVIVRPAYTLGGTGGGICNDEAELREIGENGLRLSRVHQCLIEKCIAGWKEIEYEVVRDHKGNVITVCNMENLDPVGVHTGDSIVVAPSQTLSDKEYQMLRTSALNIISALGIEGGCNVQFALHPTSFEYAVIEVNPRVSRSSALASKATGYPIAKVATKIAIGYGMDEIINAVTGKTYACFEPTLDYCVVKIPKWPFDKFVRAERTLGTQMKATGEVMAISNSFEGALMKAIRSLELNMYTLEQPFCTQLTKEELDEKLYLINDERIFILAEAMRRGYDLDTLYEITKIDHWFLQRIERLVQTEEWLKTQKLENFDAKSLRRVKQLGFPDRVIAQYVGCTRAQVKAMRVALNVQASYKMVDTCGAEFEAVSPYYYSTYDEATDAQPSQNKKVLVIGSGPIRIGQGIEFDYCSVHAVWALKKLGYETIIANNNPETVSTDFDTSDVLYFEPLTDEDVENIVETEKPMGAIVQVGGQTAIKLTQALSDMGVPILGSQPDSVDAAEDRQRFDEVLEKCGVPRPAGKTIFTTEEALQAAAELQYPVLLRPSYVLGGQGMEIAYNDKDVVEFMSIIQRTVQEHPILVDKYMMGTEIEVDAICDGDDILIPGIMEHVERAGVHSGDSISVYPSISLSPSIQAVIMEATKKLAKALNVIGLVNIQYVLYKSRIYVIEVNPRSSRTVPYISKVTGVPMVEVAVRTMFGEKLRDMPYGTGLYPTSHYHAVKAPVFSFEKLHNVDTNLGPEMKSTGEVLGVAKSLEDALLKAITATNVKLPQPGSDIIITVRDSDKEDILPMARYFDQNGFHIYATQGTAKLLNSQGIHAEEVFPIDVGSPNVLDILHRGNTGLVINTPTRGRKPERDGFRIRRKTVECSVPCLTSLDTANAMIRCMQLHKQPGDLDVVDLNSIT